MVGRQAGALSAGKGRKRLVAVIVGALLGVAIHYGSLAVDEWAVIHVTDPETSRTAIA